MMRVLTIVLSIVVLQAATAAGAPLPLLPGQPTTLELPLARYLQYGHFGDDGVLIESDIDVSPWGARCYPIECGAVNWPSMYGRLASGPLVGFSTYVERDDPFSLYEFEDGIFTLFAEWMSPSGKTRTGTFSAPIVSTSSGMYDVRGPGMILGVHEEGGPFSPDADHFWTFGPGEFSPRLARHLGVKRKTAGGYFDLIWEVIDGDPHSSTRSGVLYLADANIDVVAIPEPDLIGLVTVAAAAFGLRRRARPRDK